MKRSELEHLLRASKGATGEQDFIIIGSQSVLGKHPDAPRELRQSMELDIYVRSKPEELRIEIERNLGELSRFSVTFGYFADGATGWCIDPADLTIAKLYANRPKDISFIRAMLKHRFIRPSQIERLIATFADETIRQRLLNAFAVCRQPH